MGNLTIEILKLVEKCKIYQDKGTRKARGRRFEEKIFPVAGI